MLEWLWNADEGWWLGAFGFVTAIASLVYARNQARGAKAQVEGARRQAVEALLAAQLVAKGARETAAEALLAAGLVAKGARETAAEALRAAGLVAKGARETAAEALRAAELLANSSVSARVREVRARNLRSNPDLPSPIRALIKQAGGPEAYSVMLDSVDIAQEIYALRKRGMVSDEHWRLWMDDQVMLIARSPSFKAVFHRAANAGVLRRDFVEAFESVSEGRGLADPRVARAPDRPKAVDAATNGLAVVRVLAAAPSRSRVVSGDPLVVVAPPRTRPGHRSKELLRQDGKRLTPVARGPRAPRRRLNRT